MQLTTPCSNLTVSFDQIFKTKNGFIAGMQFEPIHNSSIYTDINLLTSDTETEFEITITNNNTITSTPEITFQPCCTAITTTETVISTITTKF